MKKRKISKKKLIALSGISAYDYRKMREKSRCKRVSNTKSVLSIFSRYMGSDYF